MTLPEVPTNDEAQITARELDTAFHGMLVKIPNPSRDLNAAIPGPEHRTITLGGVRPYVRPDKVSVVGLLDLSTDGPWRGTEYQIEASAVVQPIRRVRVGKPRKGDYPTEASRG